jgi:hypothetical protein
MVACIDFFEMSEICRPKFIVRHSKCKACGHKMAVGSTERTPGYFGDQTPSQSKKPCFPSSSSSSNTFYSVLFGTFYGVVFTIYTIYVLTAAEAYGLFSRPCFPSRNRFYHFWRTPLSQPLLDQSDQSARFYFTPTATPFRYL